MSKSLNSENKKKVKIISSDLCQVKAAYALLGALQFFRAIRTKRLA
jgi:hypothetical protein